MLRKTFLVLAIASTLAACSKESNEPAKAGAPATAKANGGKNLPTSLTVAPEDILTVKSNAMTSGPVVTGSVQPERRADLRAEVSAVVLQVLKENGDTVRKGDLLVRLDDTAIRDALNSADEAARAASQAFEQAERTLTRMKTLRESGMTSVQAMDDAQVRRNNAQSDLAAAKSRAATARQQLARTAVRAPFDGVVSDRKVSAGDTAAIGKELVKVIDPNSMRFEGRVSADNIAHVRSGLPVTFRVNGYGDQEFRGVVRRVDPAANDVTRQVEVLVAFAKDSPQPRVSGLYAEGTILADARDAVALPEQAVVRAGDSAYAWRIKDNQLQKASVKLGARDARTGYYEIKEGLATGDIVLRSPSSNFQPGQKIVMSAAAKMASAADTTKPAQGK